MEDPATARDRPDNSVSRTDRLIYLIQSSGGALCVLLAITFTFVVALVAIPLAPGGDRVTLATAAFTGIGTIAGAYFGVRVGSDGKERAERDRNEAQLVVERVASKVAEAPVREAREEIRQEQRDEAAS